MSRTTTGWRANGCGGSGPRRTVGKAIVNEARAVARAARRGGVDISCPADEDLTEAPEGPVSVENGEVEKTENDKRKSGDSLAQDQALREKSRKMDLRISEVRVRGSDSGTESYVGRTLGSLSQDSIRPTDGREVPYRESEPPPISPSSIIGSVHGRGVILESAVEKRADPGVELGWSPRQAV
jgi:hypothetical protein